MLWQIIPLIFICWLLWVQWKTRKLRSLMKQMKSDLTSLPIVGNAHHFMGGGEIRMSTIESLGKSAIKYGGWAPLQLGPHFYAMAADASEVSYVVKTHLEKDNILNIFQNLLGNGLIFAPVSIWRPRRKILAPTFSQHNLNKFVEIFYTQSSVMVDNLSQEADRGVFSIWKYITSYTMDSVCQTTLGSDIGVQKTSDHKFLQLFKQYAEISATRIFTPWLHNETSFKYICYFGMYQKIAKSIDFLKGFVFDIIDKKHKTMKEDYEKCTPSDQNGTQRFKPILELLIQASAGEQGFANNELQEETQVILLAGTDTSAVGAAFVTLMLAKHPDVQEKVYEELTKVYGNSDRPTEPDDFSHLSYLEAVIKETLRLYPPVPVTARKVLKDSVTPAGVHLPAGIGVVIFHWAIHRNPKYWGGDAQEFRPERFFDSPPTHPAAFLPFSTGPRNCLGYKYAMMSMMTMTATLLRRYRILPSEELKRPLRLSYDVMLKHVDNFQVKLESRKLK